ncbi:MAG: hypothetical protein OEP48_10995 [Betaproteobacteria bacterium]|nr:hypothetical protein [Betaproteobacteria bacterium]MDH3436344.1 hypothetical protein [Betaproteobacteria bacterium]
MDRALHITWYDLPEKGQEDHLSWLRGTYIPKVLKRPGVLWAAHYASEKLQIPVRIRHTDDAALPAGNDYILLFGAESSHAFTRGADSFAEDRPSKFEAALSVADRKMLAMRSSARVCLMTEEARVEGPEAGRREKGIALSPCIQLGSFNGGSCEGEEELLAWYADWRMPALSKLPGCVAMRKMVSVVGWAKHGVLYEFVSLQARNEGMPQVARLYPEMEAWTNRFIPKLTHAPGSPNVARRIWPVPK